MSPHATAYTRAVIALGSNLGARNDTLSAAVADLVDPPEVRLLAISPIVQSKAVGGPPDQPDFLNMVIAVETSLSPEELLRHCHAVEHKHLRVREVRWGPRTLDVDIVTYGELVSSDPDLTLPHPRAAERAFVLYPWSLIEPAARLNGERVGELAAKAADFADLAPFDGFEDLNGVAGAVEAP
ncbi:2-amino-4-hydroxy-6-hydroxymethyldihydropteridine diphosphokinase [Arthrobacter sp. UYEF3]|uniref:2-amino-4-hydroxy-6- hydroxymethyldihydropteridine diphosphokinase n=1 Tax=Arthrobacter sp. UYEF3 TaxID=1756365 RepID=UPI003392C1D4